MLRLLVDDREKRPYDFADYPVATEERRLQTGDYALAQDGRFDGRTFKPRFAVERKTKDDFLRSITHNRERFERELGRASKWPLPLSVCVETPETALRGGRYRRDIHPNAVRGTIDSWRSRKPATLNFFDSREVAEEFTFRLLRWRDIHSIDDT